ncbi:MAG TPA: competence/damage-inducible protein A [Eubacteriales bacterium]|nr:competence/damage-inducible protein A [Eubacteriales bacterium]
MVAEIVSVGTELLMGQVVNTDAQYIASRLAPLGLQVYYHTTVGDNVKRLTAVVHQAVERSDVVVFTGGLGPTDDDLTKETVAAALGLTVEPIPEEVERLKAYFTSHGYQMTPNNLKQASFPKGALILRNEFGTAPGCIMSAGGKTAVLLPGPPRELFPMFSNHVMPYLEKLSGAKLYSRELRIFGMGESSVTYQLKDIIEEQTNPTVAPYVKTGEVTLRVTALCRNDEEGEALARPVIDEIVARLGDVVYSTVGESLPETCARMLTDDGATLAVAESCTGGMIADELVAIPGCSKFLIEGCVTYSDAAKVKRLGVKEETLKKFGAVSEECAAEMAQGMLKTSGADYALATTGFAGPDGGTEQAPVGTVFIAIAGRSGVAVKRLSLHGERARIRLGAALNAFDLLRRELCK